MLHRLIVILAGMAFCLCAEAQLRGIVVDMSTGVPLRDVVIYTNHNETDTTNYLGEFEFRQAFEWAVASHPTYLQRRMTIAEMRADTIRLIPLCNELSEVVITAERPRIGEGIIAGVNAAIAEGAAAAPHGIASFDFFAPLARFDKSRRWVSKKQRRRQREVLDNY